MKFNKIDMAGRFFIQEVGALPAATSADERRLIYYSGKIYYCDGTNWLPAIYVNATSEVDLSGNMLTNVNDPTTDSDVGDRGYNDLRYAAIADGVTNGDTHDHSGGDGAVIPESGLDATVQAQLVTNGDTHDHSGGDGAVIPDAALSSGATVVSAGAGDSGKLVKLDADGNVDSTTINDADIDHGSIGGTGDDDHSQYALLAGRSGGQTLQGGTDASDDLYIDSTSNVTKGTVYCFSDFDLNGNMLINVADPTGGSEVGDRDYNDLRYAAIADGVTNGDSHDHSGGDGAQIDHGGLAGLSDDDHSQYALLAGRSGGQALQGGTDASDDLTLESTSNGTKGDVIVASGSDLTITDGNLVMGTSGKGIDFSATSDLGGMSSELLDDYEEGTFTPVLTFGGGSTGITYSVQLGRYTKIGRFVYVSIGLILTSKGTDTGDALLSGLPFTCVNNSAGYAGIFGRVSGTTWSEGRQFYIPINTTNVNLEESNEAGTIDQLDNTNFTDSSSLLISGCYEAA